MTLVFWLIWLLEYLFILIKDSKWPNISDFFDYWIFIEINQRFYMSKILWFIWLFEYLMELIKISKIFWFVWIFEYLLKLFKNFKWPKSFAFEYLLELIKDSICQKYFDSFDYLNIWWN